jgi:hypothetical protein
MLYNNINIYIDMDRSYYYYFEIDIDDYNNDDKLLHVYKAINRQAYDKWKIYYKDCHQCRLMHN